MINKKYGLSQTQITRYGFKLALEVYDKGGRKCALCNSTDKLQIHHLDNSGKSKNPNNSLDNLQLICIKCHSSISSKEYWAKQAKLRGGYLWKGREKEWDRENHKKHRVNKKII